MAWIKRQAIHNNPVFASLKILCNPFKGIVNPIYGCTILTKDYIPLIPILTLTEGCGSMVHTILYCSFEQENKLQFVLRIDKMAGYRSIYITS